jgi:hypothetical protein
LLLSHGVPVGDSPKNESKVNAATRAPLALSKMPIDVLTVWM